MAAATLRRAAWPVAALLAAGFLTVLAFHGERPEPGLVRFEPAGVMLGLPPASVRGVDVTAGGRRWQFTRGGGETWAAAAGAPPASRDLGAALELGLKLLHDSSPARVMGAAEVEGTSAAEFGLDPPTLSVTARSNGTAFTVHFGGRNPLGLARYARVDGRPGLVLLPDFVVASWERVIAPP